MLLTYPADPADPTLRAAFFAPWEALFAAGKLASTRPCPELPDQAFVQIGVQRVLDQGASGRDFLQRLRELFSMTLGRSNFFAACNSARRLELVREVNEQLPAAELAGLRRRRDPLASIPELNGRGSPARPTPASPLRRLGGLGGRGHLPGACLPRCARRRGLLPCHQTYL